MLLQHPSFTSIHYPQSLSRVSLPNTTCPCGIPSLHCTGIPVHPLPQTNGQLPTVLSISSNVIGGLIFFSEVPLYLTYVTNLSETLPLSLTDSTQHNTLQIHPHCSSNLHYTIFLKAEQCSIVCIYYNFLMQTSVHGHVDCFLVLVIAYRAPVNVEKEMSSLHCALGPIVYAYIRNGIAV